MRLYTESYIGKVVEVVLEDKRVVLECYYWKLSESESAHKAPSLEEEL